MYALHKECDYKTGSKYVVTTVANTACDSINQCMWLNFKFSYALKIHYSAVWKCFLVLSPVFGVYYSVKVALLCKISLGW